ncbi:uncharacterized protein K452DRAFT_198472, partial [Aplosporella prunicola CBS 121167]
PPLPQIPSQKVPHTSSMDTVSRSMSRYRRQRPAIATSHAAHAPPMPGSIKRAGTLPVGPCPAQDNSPLTRAQSNPGGPTLDAEAEHQARLSAQLKAEKRARAEEAERSRRLEQRAADLRARQDASRERSLLARKDEEEHERLVERQRPRTAKNSSSQHGGDGAVMPPSPQSPEPKRKFGFLRRRKEEEPAKSADVSGHGRQRQVSDDLPDTIRPGGGGVVPGIDAPISAVNAGDRRVLVECNRSRILLPVTPTTTVLDLIRSASTCLAEPIDAKASVLLEAFSKAGVQRPLRHYERVRDIMNSWDDDNQNSLVLVDSPTGGNDHDLSASSVPADKPQGLSCSMYYSQKPGKWTKKWVTLRNDGQILLSKNESGKDSSNMCHLSDFDIYTPTARNAAEKVKPPKKVCFAIKSQQKSTMFISTSNFVHFMCTGHKDDAADFYNAVQGWRSWYLVNVLGEGSKKSKTAADTSAPDAGETHSASASQSTQAHHRPANSVDSHYQLGSFKPLIDVGRLNQPPVLEQSSVFHSEDKDSGTTSSQEMYTRKMSLRSRSQPPVAFPSHMAATTEPPLSQSATDSSDDGTFAANSLLGRAYSQRQKMQRERELASKQGGPFTEGPSLLKNHLDGYSSHASAEDAMPKRMSSVRSTRGAGHAGDVKRSNTTRHGREMPKPLVDLTPQYKAPPQFQKKGKGFHPDHVGPGGLIDSATSPDVVIAVPPSQDWRGRSTATRPATSSGPSADRTKSLRGHGMKIHGAMNNHSNVPESGDDAFTGRGLLAHPEYTTAAPIPPHGHGVMDGSKAKGPMLDMSESSQFAPGSLLANVAAQNPTVPIIDRERKRSVDLPTGE